MLLGDLNAEPEVFSSLAARLQTGQLVDATATPARTGMEEGLVPAEPTIQSE